MEMVEADRSVARDQRQPFLLMGMLSGYVLIHPGLKRDAAYPADLHTLAQWSPIRLGYTNRGDEKYDVTPTGRRYYEWMKEPGWGAHRARRG